jgi:hypothetical protein
MMDWLDRVAAGFFAAAAVFWFVVGVVVSAQGYPAVWVIAGPISAIFAWGAHVLVTE